MIKEIIFDGFKAIEIETKSWKLIAVYECGPRIAFLGKKDSDDNILYWDKNGVKNGDWVLHGGHRVWITRPYADESVDTYTSDNEECLVEIDGYNVNLTSPKHDFTNLSRGIKISIIDNNKFEVTNFIKNDGSLIYSGGVWSPTCINPNGKVIKVPLGEDDTTWDIVKIVIPRVFAGNKVLLNDEQVSFTEKEMIIKPNNVITKRCVSAPKGTVYCEWEEKGIKFSKTSDYIKDGKYPLDGCNIAVFVGENNWMAEMETFGVEQSIKPQETILNKEVWLLEDM